MDLQRLFTEHPASVGETYGEHLVHASAFGWRMVLAGLACMVHAVLPFMFVKTGSVAINELHTRMVTRRVPQTRALAEAEAAAQARAGRAA